MKITRASDYAIRLLAHLASNGLEGKSDELARDLDIPFNHLAKLVQALARRGYLATRRGKGGGIKLAVDPRDISLRQVIEAVEGPLVISNCLFHREICRFSPKCRARQCLALVRQKINEVFSATTIFDLGITN